MVFCHKQIFVTEISHRKVYLQQTPVTERCFCDIRKFPFLCRESDEKNVRTFTEHLIKNEHEIKEENNFVEPWLVLGPDLALHIPLCPLWAKLEKLIMVIMWLAADLAQNHLQFPATSLNDTTEDSASIRLGGKLKRAFNLLWGVNQGHWLPLLQASG